MRQHLFLLRMARSMMISCAVLAGIFVGRASINHAWMELVGGALWLINTAQWGWRLHVLDRRERQELKHILDGWREHDAEHF